MNAMQFREYNLIELFSSIIHFSSACPRGMKTRRDTHLSLSVAAMLCLYNTPPRMLMAVILLSPTARAIPG